MKMAARFIVFLIIFSFIFAFFGKWIYMYFKNLLNKESRKFDEVHDDVEFEGKRCRDIDSHNLKDKRLFTKCAWCGLSVKEIKEIQKKKDLVNNYY